MGFRVTIWNGDSDVERCMTKPLLNRFHRNVVGKQKACTAVTQVMETEHLHIVLFDIDIPNKPCQNHQDVILSPQLNLAEIKQHNSYRVR